MLRRSFRRRGFSLIEAAIVLGIIGLVTGGIWVAAAAVSRNHKINTTLEAIGIGHEKAQAMYKNMASGGLISITALRSNTSMPGGYITNSSWPGYVRGNEVLQMRIDTINSSDYAPYFTTMYWFNVTLGFSVWGTNKEVCIALSSRLLDLNLGRAPISTIGSLTWYTNFSIATAWRTGDPKPTPAQIASYCSTATQLYVFWAL